MLEIKINARQLINMVAGPAKDSFMVMQSLVSTIKARNPVKQENVEMRFHFCLTKS